MQELIVSLAIMALVGAAPQGMSSAEFDPVFETILRESDYNTSKTFVTNNDPAFTMVSPVGEPEFEPVVRCRTNKGLDGVCIPYYSCDTNESVNTDGDGRLDIRFSVTRSVRRCTNELHVCCTPPDIRPPVKTTPPSEKLPRNGNKAAGVAAAARDKGEKQNDCTDNDEVENFGKYITSLLRKLPEETCTKLQMAIVDLILRTRLESAAGRMVPNVTAGNAAYMTVSNAKKKNVNDDFNLAYFTWR